MVDIKKIMRENIRLRLISITLIVIVIIILTSYADPRQNSVNQSSNLSSSNPLSLPSLKEASSSLVLFLIAVFILVIVIEIIYRLLWDEIKNLEILPFETNDEKELDSQAITDSILANLQRIHDVLPKSEKLLRNEAELLSIPTTGTTGIMWEGILKDSKQENDRVANQLNDAVKLNAGGWELLILPLISAVFRLRKIGDNGCIVRGSFQKYGENVFGQAIVKTKKSSFACETRGPYDKLPELIKDLAFDIAFKLSEIKWLDKTLNKKENINDDINKSRTTANGCAKKYLNNNVVGWSGTASFDYIIKDVHNEAITLNRNIEKLEKYYGNRDDGCEKKCRYFYDRNDDAIDFYDRNDDAIDSKAKKIEKLNSIIFEGIPQDERNWCDTTRRIMNKCKNKDKHFHLNRLQLEEVCPDLKDRLPIKSSIGLKYFTEAADEFLQYKNTKNIDHLNRAKDKCKSAYGEENNVTFLSMFHGLGLAYYDKEKYEIAAEMFSEAIKNNPNAASFCGKGFCQKYQGHFKDAIEEFENAISYDKRDYDKSWILLGAIYYSLGHYAIDLYNISVACFYEAIKRDSKLPYPWLILSLIYYRKHYSNMDEKIKAKYAKVALCCINKSIHLSRRYGYKDFFPIQLDQKETLEILVDPNGGKERKYSSYFLKNNPYDRACQASLRNRKEEAKRYLEEALEKKFAYGALVLFDPDLKSIERKELEEILKKYPDDIERLKEIRGILKENLKIVDKYILASFEATCHFCDNAIEYLKEFSDSELKRFEMDPHFDSIHYLAVSVRINKKSIAYGSIELKLVLTKTSEDRVIDISTVFILPKGLILASTLKSKFLLRWEKVPEKRWEQKIIDQRIIIVDEKALSLPVKVKIIAKAKGRISHTNGNKFERIYNQPITFEESGNEYGNIITFLIMRKIIFVQDDSLTQLSDAAAESKISMQNMDDFSCMAGF